jgi:hypothetical protein
MQGVADSVAIVGLMATRGSKENDENARCDNNADVPQRTSVLRARALDVAP